jgi:enoyl-CoA hydratase/3-hydroxyacyl-CoA dehydrogenase
MIVGVIGSGSIGPDLAYGFLSALARRPAARVYLVDIKEEALAAGVERIRGYLAKGLARGKLTAEAGRAIETALTPTLRLADLADCDYVLEAASENLEVKRAILAELEDVVSERCLIGFATSGLPRAWIAEGARHPERCFVNHPFFPAWRSLPIEVVLAGDEVLGARMIQTLRRLGKVPIVTADAPCFAADDIFCNYISEAARIVEEGLASPAQVDRIVHAAIGGGGPFNVMDLTRGNLLTVHCQELMRDADTGGPWFEPPAILRQRGDAPWHDRRAPGDPRHSPEQGRAVTDRILAVLLARTYFVLDQGICEATDLNWLTRMALGFNKGLLEIAADLGADRVTSVCREHAAAHPGFPVPQSIAEGRLARFRTAVKLERDGDVGVVSVFRPEARGALSDAVIAEIDEAIAALAADDQVAAIVLTSDDGALAGADVFGIAALETPEDCRQICLRAHPVLARIESCAKPVVAAVDGPVMGGGCELVMACHARVVGHRLQLAQPEVNLGIIPGYGGSQRLPRLIGFERANDLLRTARPVGAAEACAWGWAHGEPAADPRAAAVALARRAAAGEVAIGPIDPAPIAVPDPIPAVDIGHRSRVIDAVLVDVMRRGLARPLAEGLAIEADGFARCKATVDMDIGIKNFIQNGPRVPAAFLHE